MKKAKKYSNNHFIIEFNTQFFFDEVEISNNQSVFIQVNMVPEGCLDPNADELTMNLVADYVKPIDLGWAELTRAKIASNVNEYLISLNGIQCSDTTRLLIQTIPEISIHPPTLEFFGKDYTIGNDRYLVQNIDKAFLEQTVLRNVSFHIEDYEKAAIVGINGAGKTTLLRIIMGQLSPDNGIVTLSKGKSIGYLAQNASVDSNNTIYTELLSVKQNLVELEAKIRQAELDMEKLPADSSELTTLMNSYSLMNHQFEL